MKKEINSALEKIILDCQALREKYGFEYTQKCYATLSRYSREIVENNLIEKSENKTWAKQLCMANSLKFQFSDLERKVLYEVPADKISKTSLNDFVTLFASMDEDDQIIEKKYLINQLDDIDSKEHVSDPICFRFNECRTGLYLYFSHI